MGGMSNLHTQLALRARPQVMGRHVAIASDHYLAAEAGMSVARAGGNVIDIAAAVAFAQNVLKPHETSFGGECPVLYHEAKTGIVHSVSGVGYSPAAANIAFFAGKGYDLIPGRGFLPAIVPAFLATWVFLLARFGTRSLAQTLTPAWELAHHGFPMYEELRSAITRLQPVWDEWPTSRAYALPDGTIPATGTLFRNPALASVLKQLFEAEARHSHHSRAAGLLAAHDLFYRGELAKHLLDFIHTTPVRDHTGQSHTALLSAADFADYQPHLEAPLTHTYQGHLIHKCAFTQGPAFLQQLALLDGFDLPALGLSSAEHIHTVTEAAKLALADREAHYGDPAVDNPPFQTLLSAAYNAQRRRLIDPARANPDVRPGLAPAHDVENPRLDAARALGLPLPNAPTPGNPKDTTHLDVADVHGNLVSATPSGGWFSASPIIPTHGFALTTRGDVFYLNPNRPNALAPRKRPRITITPSLALYQGGTAGVAFGMRGGDIQDQITLQFCLNHLAHRLPLQHALDVPVHYTESIPNSFFPKTRHPNRLCIQNRLPEAVLQSLRERGHELVFLDTYKPNPMAAGLDPVTRLPQAAVCSDSGPCYAVAW
jgi:gamma-glutamyltranspeptidase / glutathione hydrolase